ncbi:hypothetical protein AAJ76_383000497 [Vairimorpha ceranae]|uniref:Uncharacterized protein n=1 Tax=Vairimorpha ceranae TaxID=40302 RepID=A0A0F9Z6P3_9MICR|nr:hypothetical protein AAJ76_383000497 [Vairimorpha ceranae]KAF5139745.1 hypothetical protein G9O61_00g020950 [Vairimorpha ceranae]KAF5140254.1 hypothetical protein G9O61_00g015860 [Vairimorpha ceranae]KKO73614.1 hypothetical protein AAJ76_383000497 [Vairimorpha ceranae]
MKKKENFSKKFSQEKYFYFVMRFILKKGFLKTNDPYKLLLKTLAFHTYTYIQFISLSRIFDDDMSYPAAIYNFVNRALDIKFNKKCNWKIDQLLVPKNNDIKKLLTYSLVKDRITKKDFEMFYRQRCYVLIINDSNQLFTSIFKNSSYIYPSILYNATVFPENPSLNSFGDMRH